VDLVLLVDDRVASELGAAAHVRKGLVDAKSEVLVVAVFPLDQNLDEVVGARNLPPILTNSSNHFRPSVFLVEGRRNVASFPRYEYQTDLWFDRNVRTGGASGGTLECFQNTARRFFAEWICTGGITTPGVFSIRKESAVG